MINLQAELLIVCLQLEVNHFCIPDQHSVIVQTVMRFILTLIYSCCGPGLRHITFEKSGLFATDVELLKHFFSVRKIELKAPFSLRIVIYRLLVAVVTSIMPLSKNWILSVFVVPKFFGRMNFDPTTIYNPRDTVSRIDERDDKNLLLRKQTYP